MKKNSIIAIVIIVLVVVAVGVAAATRNSSNTNNSTNTSSSDMTKSSTTSTAPTATDKVTIENFAFSPADITVKKGTSVTWTNNDSTTHTVTETDSQAGPDSGDLASGKSYSFVFDTAGTFHYHCTIHTDMTGTVTVTE